MIKDKKRKNPKGLDLPPMKDPLDDVKDRKIDRNGKLDIPDPLDDVK